MPAVVPGPGQNSNVITQALAKGLNDPKLHQRDSVGFLEGKERVIFMGPTMMKVTIQMVMEAVIAAAPPVISLCAGPCPEHSPPLIRYLQVTNQGTGAEVG